LQLLTPFTEWNGADFKELPLLIKAKGKCTTDHISMAGYWLKFRGHLQNISQNYMIGAVNFFNDQTNTVLNQLSSLYDTVPKTALAYRDSGTGSIVAGEENFGEGSSREHAAMEPRYLGVKVLLVKSFARIHETNLKKQGILTLTFQNKNDYDKIKEDDKIDIGVSRLLPGKPVVVTLSHSDGTKEDFLANHSYNDSQIEWFKAGSALNIIRKSNQKNVI
jgi:aconitate hydratase